MFVCIKYWVHSIKYEILIFLNTLYILKITTNIEFTKLLSTSGFIDKRKNGLNVLGSDRFLQIFYRKIISKHLLCKRTVHYKKHHP
jgi:hypothetical protein